MDCLPGMSFSLACLYTLESYLACTLHDSVCVTNLNVFNLLVCPLWANSNLQEHIQGHLDSTTRLRGAPIPS